MKVAVIGGGAVGLLLSSYLRINGHDVSLFTRTKGQAERIKKDGVRFIKEHKTKKLLIPTATSENISDEFELFIVAVKQYSIKDVVQQLKNLKSKYIMFVQNGMNHIHETESLESNNNKIIFGIVEHGAYKINENTVEHTGEGRIKIGQFHHKLANLEVVKRELESTNFPIVIEDDCYLMLAKKLAANAIINPLTALYKVKNGRLLDHPFLENMKKAYEEIANVLDLKNNNEVWEGIMAICKSTEGNTSSMLKDILENRRTEIDAILGYIIEKGQEKKLEIPLTKFLYNSIKGIEEG